MKKSECFNYEYFQNKEEVIINPIFVNVFAFIVLLLAVIIFGIPFHFILGKLNKSILTEFYQYPYNVVMFFIILVAGFFIHELILGLFFAKFANSGFKSLRFGFLKKAIVAYCVCNEEIKLHHAIIAYSMPTFILSIMPIIISMLSVNIFMLVFGIIFLAAGTSDIVIIFKLLQQPKNSWILGNVSNIGFYVYTPITG